MSNIKLFLLEIANIKYDLVTLWFDALIDLVSRVTQCHVGILLSVQHCSVGIIIKVIAIGSNFTADGTMRV